LITNQLLCLLSYTGIHANQNTTIAAFIRQEKSRVIKSKFVRE